MINLPSPAMDRMRRFADDPSWKARKSHRGKAPVEFFQKGRLSERLFEDEILQPPDRRLWQFGIDQKMAVDNFRMQHTPAGLH